MSFFTLATAMLLTLSFMNLDPKAFQTLIKSNSPTTKHVIPPKTDIKKCFTNFKKQLLNAQGMKAIVHFPFYTAKASLADSMLPTDAITAEAFKKYYPEIFTADVLRLMPAYPLADLTEIDVKTKDPYYRELLKITDPGMPLYEAYRQFPESGTAAESYFGFVFGKIKGDYKLVAYYGKWPVVG